ncbi:MAG: TerC family protein, partial [Methyloceanibacter sp.]
MAALFAPAAFVALAAVVVIDVVLSGDNAIILGLATMGLPSELRTRVIAFGVALATGLRIVLALVALPLLEIVGLTLAGGILLLWVAWKIWREIGAASS